MPNILGVLPPEEAMRIVKEHLRDPMNAQKLGIDPRSSNLGPEMIQELAQRILDGYANLGEASEQGEEIGETMKDMSNQMMAVENLQSHSEPFNLLKIAQVQQPFMFDVQDEPGNEQMEMQGDFLEDLNIEDNPSNWFFESPDDFRHWLDTQEPEDVIQKIMQLIDEDQMLSDGRPVLEVMKESLTRFFEANPEESIEVTDENGKPERRTVRDYMANQAYEALPGSVKGHGEHDIDSVQVQQKEIKSMNSEIIKETNEAIKRMAEQSVKTIVRSESYNRIKKIAQHKTMDNAILWGPGQTKIDPFLMQPVSDWHIVERNKGFGMTMGDRWNIDWEAIWRGNIMDKYSRPYRDKDGNWVGGYIQKRFEVDKNIPPTNNLQLKPGQRRRPYMPQYGSTEARLEHMRKDDERGYGPFSKGDPTQWDQEGFAKIAQVAQTLPTAEMGEMQEASPQNLETTVELVISTMSPDQKSQFVDAYRQQKWSDAYYALGELYLPEHVLRQVADRVYLTLSHGVTTQQSNLAMASIKKKVKQKKLCLW